MLAPVFTRRARFVGAAIVLSLCASHAFAEPPRHAVLKMRNAPRASAVLTTLSQAEPAPPPKVEQAPQAEPAATVDPAKVESAAKEATAVLQLCYELARRSDPSLKAPFSLHATVRADGALELRAATQSLGNGFFTRCVGRKLATIVSVRKLPEPTASTRTIVLGAAPVAIVR